MSKSLLYPVGRTVCFVGSFAAASLIAMSELLATINAATNQAGPDVPTAIDGAGDFLPAHFDVDGLAAASVAAAGAGAADLLAARNGSESPWVTISARAASAAFVSEKLFAPNGWELPAVWDPIAGDYRAGERWIRLHTNYEGHRRAALSVLDCANDRVAVERAVAGWNAVELQEAVVAQGGCAAVLSSIDQWQASEPGRAASTEPLVRWNAREVKRKPKGPAALPFTGIRVLDLTRVIAGPVATKFLAAYGAEVLRIDPPGFVEVPALLPETTAGKHCAALDLGAPRDRDTFAQLVAKADVVVSGLRPGALDRLGLGREELLAVNPALVTARLNAYGWSGPWANRRGFDSLVQMSTGIADRGEAEPPEPLPAQALDHATGYIVAAAIGRALARREREGVANDIDCSLVATAQLLLAQPTNPEGPATTWTDADTEPTETEWGSARRAPVPAVIAEITPQLAPQAGSLGRHAAAWR